jgi:glutamate carboxypeptidase
MTPSTLPFDTAGMLAGLRRWVECESPTYDPAAVNRMMDIAQADLSAMGAAVERIPGTLGFGDCVRGRFAHPRAGEAGILVIGHLDTVHPVGTLAALPWRLDDDRCYGPGILDMKAGNFLVLEAMRRLAAAGATTPLPVTILLTSDEEVGSPSTRALIEAEARRHRYVLVPEPDTVGRSVVTGRYAIARFVVETTGRPSHAGAALRDGRSAIREMAREILAIEDGTTDDCTFSVGVVEGGRWVNCVPTRARAEVLSMAKRQSDLDAGVARLLARSREGDGVAVRVERTVTRPVWEPDAGTLALFETARAIGRTLGFELKHGSAGGGSDGNFTGAAGIPTLDGLGAGGRGLHTLEEHIDVGTLVPRGRLMAGLLATLE